MHHTVHNTKPACTIATSVPQALCCKWHAGPIAGHALSALAMAYFAEGTPIFLGQGILLQLPAFFLPIPGHTCGSITWVAFPQDDALWPQGGPWL
eukprot:2700592-Karenia_brevis.AAC.1